MQNEQKTNNKDDTVVIFVKTGALKSNTTKRRLKFRGKSRSEWIKTLHERLDSMNNTVEGQLFVKYQF